MVSNRENGRSEIADIGASWLTPENIAGTPTLFGEADVIKALQTQPGVATGAEGLAGMYVHGGEADENLYMLDGVPLYRATHFAGLFSAFNTDVIKDAQFYKNSIPAKFDGRLSSVLDLKTKPGGEEGHHGSAKLGLLSGAFNIGGPISDKFSYMVAARRSWFEALTVPAIAIMNAISNDSEKIRFRYAFTDINASLTYRISDRTSASASGYFGMDGFYAGGKRAAAKVMTTSRRKTMAILDGGISWLESG